MRGNWFLGEAEQQLLLELFGIGLSHAEIQALTGASRTSIVTYRKQLGIAPGLRLARWSESETLSLLSLIESKSNREIATILGRPKKSVERKLSELGITRSAAYHLKSGQAYRLYPPELREAMALQKTITRKLNDVKEHG